MHHLKGMDGGNRMEHRKEDKMRLVEKYNLKHENNAWYSEKENSHKHLIFKDAFFERADLIGLLFRINKPLKYDYRKGFLTVPLWDADFLKHKDSGLILDFRYLQSITIYDDFVSLCKELENFETE